MPQRGDLLYMVDRRAIENKNVSHVGIVTEMKGGHIYTVEGNVGAELLYGDPNRMVKEMIYKNQWDNDMLIVGIVDVRSYLGY